MIVELTGLPAAGKSYICETLLTNKDCFNLGLWIREKKVGKIIINLVRKLAKIKYKKPINAINNLLRDKKKKYEQLNVDFDIVELFTYKLIISFFEFFKINIVCDEGIYQHLIYICSVYDLNERDCVTISNLTNCTIPWIFLEIDVKDSITRIKSRNRKKCKMDYLEENILCNYIQTYDDKLSIFSTNAILGKNCILKSKSQKEVVSFITHCV